MPTRKRWPLRIVGSSALALLTVVGLAAAGAWVTSSESQPPQSGDTALDIPPSRPSSSGPIVVAVVLGASGTVGSDALAPYEVFATSPRFSVYTIAVSTALAPIQGGPAIIPTYTFADAASGIAPRPDLVVVPAVGSPDGPQEAELRTWIVQQAQNGARILGVCAGSVLLASTGILDGHTATSHWSQLGPLRKKHPETNWVSGRRFVQDGNITTTAGVTSGIPGALRVMQDLAGSAEALRVGRLVNYPDWSLTQPTEIPVQSFAPGDIPIGLNAIVPWLRPTIGVGMAAGASEIDLASVFEVYNVSYAARAIPVTATGSVVTKHGMVLLGLPERDAPPLTRLAVPGATSVAAVDPHVRTWAAQRGLPIDAVHGPNGAIGFDGALEYLSTQAGRGIAISAAKMIDYPTAQLRLADPRPAPRIPLLLALGTLIAGCVACLPVLTARRRRRSADAGLVVRGRVQSQARPSAGPAK